MFLTPNPSLSHHHQPLLSNPSLFLTPSCLPSPSNTVITTQRAVSYIQGQNLFLTTPYTTDLFLPPR